MFLGGDEAEGVVFKLAGDAIHTTWDNVELPLAAETKARGPEFRLQVLRWIGWLTSQGRGRGYDGRRRDAHGEDSDRW